MCRYGTPLDTVNGRGTIVATDFGSTKSAQMPFPRVHDLFEPAVAAHCEPIPTAPRRGRDGALPTPSTSRVVDGPLEKLDAVAEGVSDIGSVISRQGFARGNRVAGRRAAAQER